MANPKRLLVRGGQVYDHDGDVHKPKVADILIEGGNIVAVGARPPADGVQEIIDARDRLVVPGLINAHYHSHDTLCRGLFEELPLEMWLLYTLPMGANRSKEEVRARTLVGALEVAPLRHHHRAGHAGAGPARRCRAPTSSSRPIARPGFASCSRPWSGTFRRSPWCATRTACRPTCRRCWAPPDVRCAISSTIWSTSSTAIPPAARCIGRLRRSRRSAARRRCCRDAPSSPTSTISRSTPMSMRPAARC